MSDIQAKNTVMFQETENNLKQTNKYWVSESWCAYDYADKCILIFLKN